MTEGIEKLFTRNRFPFGPNLLILILYAPIGILLFILRVFISLQLCLASIILPAGTTARRLVLRVLYSVMGVFIQEKNSSEKDESCQILVSNHITPFDHLAISIVFPCLSVNGGSLPTSLRSFLCFHNIGGSQTRENVLSKIQSYLSKPNSLPLLFFPEKGSTNGNLALMKYSSWALDVNKPVMAIGLKVYRLPLLPIAPSVLGSSWAADLFYLLFSPATIYSISYVGKLTKGDGESVDAFAQRIQQVTASALDIKTSNHTPNDKVEYMKRLVREEALLSNPFYSPEVQSMALQVREVLPHLPIDIIKRDIVRTRNVDMTITNFLEGNIPEPIPSLSATPSTSSSPSRSPTRPASREEPALGTSNSGFVPGKGNLSLNDMNMAASSFGKTANERMRSFDERKALLIEKARQRYFQRIKLKQSQS